MGSHLGVGVETGWGGGGGGGGDGSGDGSSGGGDGAFPGGALREAEVLAMRRPVNVGGFVVMLYALRRVAGELPRATLPQGSVVSKKAAKRERRRRQLAGAAATGAGAAAAPRYGDDGRPAVPASSPLPPPEAPPAPPTPLVARTGREQQVYATDGAREVSGARVESV